MRGARIAGIATVLPDQQLTNEDLAERFPEWSVEKIAAKTGIRSRRIAGPDEFASDLAVAAARALLERDGVEADSIDYLIVCTQTADHIMPAVSLQAHGRLGLRTSAGATDITHGCSGYVYGLGLATALIESGQADRVLLITADTYSRLLNPADKSVRTLFGDGATATLVDLTDRRALHSFVYGSDGARGGALAVPNGGLRGGEAFGAAADLEARGLESNGYDLYMDGPEIFSFALRVVPDTAQKVLARAGLRKEDVDTWVLHQANAFMLDHLRRKLGVTGDRFVVDLALTGNTVSSSIPIALDGLGDRGERAPGTRSLLLGFGVGLSWAGAIAEW